MRPINIIGLLYYFLPLYERYKSRRSLIVFMNGILYHTFDSSNTLRNYDLICNILIIIYTNGRCYPTLKYSIISTMVWWMNNYLCDRLLISRSLSDVVHVVGIHMPLSKGLELSLRLDRGLYLLE